MGDTTNQEPDVPNPSRSSKNEQLSEQITANEKLGDLNQRANRQRRRFYSQQPKGIERLLSQHMAKRGYAATGSNDRIERAWIESVGPQLAKQTRAVGLRRGTLEVLVANSTMMQEINFQRVQLLKSMQKKLPDARITAMKLRVGKIF